MVNRNLIRSLEDNEINSLLEELSDDDIYKREFDPDSQDYDVNKLVDGQIEAHDILSLTLSFDHDIIDGAPATRFSQRLKDLIESGYGLVDPDSPAEPSSA